MFLAICCFLNEKVPIDIIYAFSMFPAKKPTAFINWSGLSSSVIIRNPVYVYVFAVLGKQKYLNAENDIAAGK